MAAERGAGRPHKSSHGERFPSLPPEGRETKDARLCFILGGQSFGFSFPVLCFKIKKESVIIMRTWSVDLAFNGRAGETPEFSLRPAALCPRSKSSARKDDKLKSPLECQRLWMPPQPRAVIVKSTSEERLAREALDIYVIALH